MSSLLDSQPKVISPIGDLFNPLTTNVFHHIETSQLICIANFDFYKKLETAKQITGKKLKPETPQQT